MGSLLTRHRQCQVLVIPEDTEADSYRSMNAEGERDDLGHHDPVVSSTLGDQQWHVRGRSQFSMNVEHGSLV